jgi:hypothetical protein
LQADAAKNLDRPQSICRRRNAIENQERRVCVCCGIDRLMATGKDYDKKDAQKLIGEMEELLNFVVSTHEEHAAIEKTETRYGVGPAHGKVYENVKVNSGWETGPWSETYWCS